jgi:hypothetical protein
MAFEDFLVALRDDKLGQLRCEEAFEAADPAQLLDLLGDPRFETTVQLRYLIGALMQFVDQPRVLHRNDRLRGEILQQRDLLVGEGVNLEASSVDHADQRAAFA